MDVKTAVIGFIVALLTSVSVWLQQRNAARKRDAARAARLGAKGRTVMEEDGAEGDPSTALGRQAFRRVEMLRGEIAEMRRLSSAPAPAPMNRGEIRQELLKMVQDELKPMKAELGRAMEQHINAWAASLRSELAALRSEVRSEVKVDVEKVRTEAMEAARKSVADFKETLDENTDRIGEIDSELQRNLGRLEGGGALAPSTTPLPRPRRRT